MALPIAICIVLGYALGNVNGAILISGLFHHEDVRRKGSGNAGLTNFYRNYGGADTFLVLVIDAGKAVLACFVGKWLFQAFGLTDVETLRLGSMVCGAATVFGHVFPMVYKFRGGKGILTCAALAAYMNIWAFLACIGLFLLVVLLTRYVSLGSVLACVLYPFMFWLFIPQNIPVVLISALTALLAIFMHRANIARLFAGTESKFSFHKKPEDHL